MKTNGLYEASGVVLWLRTNVLSTSFGSDTDYNPGDVSVRALMGFVESFFGKDVAMKACIQRGQAKKQKRKSRLLFPIEMLCCCWTQQEVSGKDHFDSSMSLAGSHFVLWSWYLAVMLAMENQETCPTCMLNDNDNICL